MPAWLVGKCIAGTSDGETCVGGVEGVGAAGRPVAGAGAVGEIALAEEREESDPWEERCAPSRRIS